MNCRRCGATLRREGDLCSKCYKELLEEEELKNDVVPVLTVKRKYKPSFLLRKRWDVLLITFLSVMTLFTAGHPIIAILAFIIGLAIILAYLAYNKALSMKEKVVFYGKKVVKTSTMPIVGGVKELSYKNIKDIVYYQHSLREKRSNMGDIVVYAKHTGYFGGFSLGDVENGKEIIQQIIDKIPINA